MENFGFVRCAIATFNSELANPDSALKKIEDMVSEAEVSRVKLIVFPELCLTGYTCQDLFFTVDLLGNAMNALKQLVSFSKSCATAIVVGAPIVFEGAMYNCAVVICHGKICGVVPKQYIPNYGEFYEKRWFTAYTPKKVQYIDMFKQSVPFGNLIFVSDLGFSLGVEICEDLWSVIPPSSYMSLAGASIIANLSSSNELVGKDEYRRELIKTQSARTISAYLYTSTGFTESTSDLVFGGSGYAFENGTKLASFERFSLDDQLRIFDVDVDSLEKDRLVNKTFADSKRNLAPDLYEKVCINQKNVWLFDGASKALARSVNPHPFVPFVNEEEVCQEIFSIQSTALARRLLAANTSKVTIGISGGLDSTLALLVCYEAFTKLGLDLSGIIGITMPGFGTTDRTYGNASKVCESLGVTLKEISIKEACIQHFKDIGHDINVHNVTYENVQARERTQILMDMANKCGALVVGTGDLSELVLGWCTYNGDHMSMYGVNSSIPKTLVKNLIEWYAVRSRASGNQELSKVLFDIIYTPISPELLPSDGKVITQKTESKVGPYELVDFFIYNFLRKRFSGRKIIYLASVAFGQKYSQEFIQACYEVFITRFHANQFKRNCIPDGPKVGSVSVSPRGDLRMPSDASPKAWKW